MSEPRLTPGDQLYEMRVLLYESGWDSTGLPQDWLRRKLEQLRAAEQRAEDAGLKARHWEAEALLRTQNSDYWQGQAEDAVRERDEALRRKEEFWQERYGKRCDELTATKGALAASQALVRSLRELLAALLQAAESGRGWAEAVTRVRAALEVKAE